MNKGGARSIRRTGAALLALCLCFALWGALPSRAEEWPWKTAAEAEAARAAAEENARNLAQESAKKNATVEKAQEGLEEAEEALAEAEEALAEAQTSGDAARIAEAEEALRAAEKETAKWTSRLEKSQAEAEALQLELMEAAMALKVATEASVTMANTELVDSSRISGSFELGEKYSGVFNEDRDPLYVSFAMTRTARVKISTTEAKVSITVLNGQGSTVLTLVPASTGKGSVCSLEEGDYTLLIAAMSEENKKFSLSVNIYDADEPLEEAEEEDDDLVEFDDETEMETLVEFD